MTIIPEYDPCARRVDGGSLSHCYHIHLLSSTPKKYHDVRVLEKCCHCGKNRDADVAQYMKKHGPYRP